MVRRRVFIDVGPLRRSKDFRYLYFGEMVSLIGSGLTTVAVPYQLYSLTGSSLQVGLASLAQLVPLIACSFVGGAIADTYDRRRVLLVAEVALAACSAALALNSTVGAKPAVWPLYVFSAASAGLSGVESPTRVAAAASILDRSDLTKMSALFQALFQTSSVVGPFLAGIVIASAGLGAAYWADVASFGAAFAGAWLLRPLPPAHQVTALGLKAVKEGLRFLRRDPTLQTVYLIDLVAMVFGMPRALFPAFGTVLFHGGARTVSYLYTAVAAGALVGALATGWVTHVKRQGRAVVIAVLVWGASITAFGVVRSLPVALLCLAIAGWADVVSAIFRNSILQLRVPDNLRGRMNAIQTAVVAGGPRLGDFESGAVATLVSPRFSVVSGGLASMAVAAVMTITMPMFWRLTLTPHAPQGDVSLSDPTTEPGPDDGTASP
jgi:MFS family permease